MLRTVCFIVIIQDYHILFAPFLFIPTFSGTQLGHKTGLMYMWVPGMSF